MISKYVAIRDAMAHHSRLLVQHRGQWVTLCPHQLGWRNETPHLVAYRVGRHPEWVCMPLLDLTYLRPEDGPWAPPAGTTVPEFGLEEIELAAARSEAVPAES